MIPVRPEAGSFFLLRAKNHRLIGLRAIRFLRFVRHANACICCTVPTRIRNYPQPFLPRRPGHGFIDMHDGLRVHAPNRSTSGFTVSATRAFVPNQCLHQYHRFALTRINNSRDFRIWGHVHSFQPSNKFLSPTPRILSWNYVITLWLQCSHNARTR